MNLTTGYDVLADASALVDNQLGVIEALSQAKKFRMDLRGPLTCRCPSCLGENNATLGWLWSIRQPAPPVSLAKTRSQIARQN